MLEIVPCLQLSYTDPSYLVDGRLLKSEECNDDCSELLSLEVILEIGTKLSYSDSKLGHPWTESCTSDCTNDIAFGYRTAR